jgi:hypothetical protein
MNDLAGSIFDLITAESRQLVLTEFPFLQEKYSLCWYPSCGYDYRHVNYHSYEGKFDVLYVHSDIVCLGSDFYELNKPNPLFETEDFSGRDGTCRIEPLEYFELNLIEHLWYPNREIVYDFREANNCKKVFLFKIKIKGFDTPIPIVFFAFENTNFFFDYILRNRVRVDTLIHINDGGMSMGLSKRKMDYIYLYLDELETTSIIVDFSFEDKRGHIKDFSFFEHFNPKLPYDHESRRRDRFDGERTERAIKGLFADWTSDRLIFPGDLDRGYFRYSKIV